MHIFQVQDFSKADFKKFGLTKQNQAKALLYLVKAKSKTCVISSVDPQLFGLNDPDPNLFILDPDTDLDLLKDPPFFFIQNMIISSENGEKGSTSS